MDAEIEHDHYACHRAIADLEKKLETLNSRLAVATEAMEKASREIHRSANEPDKMICVKGWLTKALTNINSEGGGLEK